MKILLLVLFLTAMSCNTTKDPNRGFNGDVKELKEFIYYASEKFGEPAVGELFSSSVSEYDSDGKIIKVEYDGGEFKRVIKYEYNSQGQKIKESSFNRDENLNDVSKYEYNDRGQKKNCFLFDRNGKRIWVEKYEYNDKGQEVKNSCYNNDGELQWGSIFEYNDNGRMIRTSLFDEDEELENVFEHKYTKFDDENNWLEQENYENNKICRIVKREFIYW